VNRQKLLWVILSVTLLVILILVGGLWLFRDKATVPVAEAAREPRVNYDLFEIPLHNTPLPGMQDIEAPKADEPKGDVNQQDIVIGDSRSDNDKVLSDKAVIREPAVRTTPKPRTTEPRKTTSTARTSSTARSTGNLYWIQTGSYKSKSKADSCNAVLLENGLAGRILTKTVNDDTYFRVRLGPYANKNEAEKFLTWIQKIDGLEGSYISLERSAQN
jgi:cell division protein FtsN